MREFWYRFLPLIILISLSIYKYYGGLSLYLTIFIFSAFLGIYFFLPVARRRISLYMAMILVLVVFPFIDGGFSNIYVYWVFLYIHMESLFSLSRRSFQIFTLIHMIFAVGWLFFEPALSVEWVVFVLFYYYLSWRLNHELYEKEMKQDLYEKLLGEFRSLKRQTYEAQRAARLEERTNIAREIHDSVGHKLTALIMKLQMLALKEQSQDIEELKTLAAASLDETRQAVRALKTDEIEGLASVLQLIRKLESESHIILDLTIRKGVLTARLSNRQNIVLYRVIQEALTNAMRHSRSRDVKVVLGLNALGDLDFRIENKVSPDYSFEWGFGLTGMKDRLSQVNGHLEVYVKDEWFIVKGSIPLEEKER